MPKMICGKCEVELKPETNGIIIAEMFQQNQKIYKLWEADLWKCPICGIEVVAGFAQYNFAEHHKDDCEKIVEEMKAEGRRVIYDKELTGLSEGYHAEYF